MNEGNAELVAVVNGNPAKTLDKVIAERNLDAKINGLSTLGTLIDQKRAYLSRMKFIPSDAIYAEVNNEYIEKYSSNFNSAESLEPVFLTGKATIYADGMLNIVATMKTTTPGGASTDGNPCLQIYINNELIGQIYSREDSYTSATTTVPVNYGDIVTFALYGGVKPLNGGGVLVANTTYLQANSIKFLGEVRNPRIEGKVEVIASD